MTGGSRGIGRAVCVRLASEGRHIIINYVSNEAAARETLSLVESAGGTGELLRFDVGDIAETSAALKSWQEAHPDEYIDVLVNNAGIRRDNLLLWMEPEDWFGVMKTNLDSFYNVTRPVLQPMVIHKCGRIVNVTSLSGLKGLPGLVYDRLQQLPPVQVYEANYVAPVKTEGPRSFEITQPEEGVFEIDAPWLERILEGSDVEDYESLQYFQRQLGDSGILDELVKRGVQENDTIRIGDFEFDYVF